MKTTTLPKQIIATTLESFTYSRDGANNTASLTKGEVVPFSLSAALSLFHSGKIEPVVPSERVALKAACERNVSGRKMYKTREEYDRENGITLLGQMSMMREIVSEIVQSELKKGGKK